MSNKLTVEGIVAEFGALFPLEANDPTTPFPAPKWLRTQITSLLSGIEKDIEGTRKLTGRSISGWNISKEEFYNDALDEALSLINKAKGV